MPRKSEKKHRGDAELEEAVRGMCERLPQQPRISTDFIGTVG